MKIGIIDYGMGNIKSLTNSLNYISIKSTLISDSNKMSNLDDMHENGIHDYMKLIQSTLMV